VLAGSSYRAYTGKSTMKSTLWRGLSLSALALLFAIPAMAGELKLSINSGRITLIAADVPLTQVLQEWARVGHTRFVNGDRLGGAPISVQLVNVPEKEALDIILRSASGYVAAPRAQLVADASMYDRIMIMPTSFAPPAMPVTTAAAAPQPFQRPQMPTPVDDDDEPVMVNVPPPAPMPSAPGPFANMPGPPTATGPAQTAPGPFLSTTPGVVVGAPGNGQPVQPGQPNPYQPAVVKPVGPGGGGGGA
jgi:hypothetical protein